MRQSGENPEHCPLLYLHEDIIPGESRSLGKPEKAEWYTQEHPLPKCISQKTYGTEMHAFRRRIINKKDRTEFQGNTLCGIFDAVCAVIQLPLLFFVLFRLAVRKSVAVDSSTAAFSIFMQRRRAGVLLAAQHARRFKSIGV